MNLLLLGAIGAGLYLVSQSGTKKPSVSNGTSSKVPVDKGYTILIPCKMFDIYNEEASYEYAYNQALTITKDRIKKNLDKGHAFIEPSLFGCDSSKGWPSQEYRDLEINPKYYAWVYRMYRAVNKGMVDAGLFTVKEANELILEYLKNLNEAKLDTQGLPLTVEGSLVE